MIPNNAKGIPRKVAYELVKTKSHSFVPLQTTELLVKWIIARYKESKKPIVPNSRNDQYIFFINFILPDFK